VPTWRFKERDEGIIEADLGPEWRGFSEALNDAVSTRAPRGHPSGLSNYWIDRTMDALVAAKELGARLASGNATSLILGDGLVIAHSDYDLWEDESMPIPDFEAGMNAWRAMTEQRLGEHF
jgi:hypothetical protein